MTSDAIGQRVQAHRWCNERMLDRFRKTFHRVTLRQWSLWMYMGWRHVGGIERGTRLRDPSSTRHREIPLHSIITNATTFPYKALQNVAHSTEIFMEYCFKCVITGGSLLPRQFVVATEETLVPSWSELFKDIHSILPFISWLTDRFYQLTRHTQSPESLRLLKDRFIPCRFDHHIFKIIKLNMK